MKEKILLGAVGEKDAVLAFRAIGIRALPAASAAEASQAIHQLKNEGVRVIFITEAAARLAPEMVERYLSDPTLAIIPVPGTQGSDGLGMERVRQNVIKAIGAELQLDNEQK